MFCIVFVCVVASIRVGYASSIEHPRDSQRMVASVSEQSVDHSVSVEDASTPLKYVSVRFCNTIYYSFLRYRFNH